MDAMLTKNADDLARELAGNATTLDDLNGMMRSLMKTAIETMLHSEMSVHLGRGRASVVAEAERGEKRVIDAVSEGTETSSVASTGKAARNYSVSGSTKPKGRSSG